MTTDDTSLPPLPVEPLGSAEEPPVAARDNSWRNRVLVLSVILVLVGGVVALLLSRDGTPSPTKALAQVRDFVAEEKTATWVSTSESTYAPKVGDLGHSSTNRSRSTGELVLPDRAHRVVEGGQYAHEVIHNGNEHYARSAESRDKLATEKWVRWTMDQGEAFGGPPGPTTALGDSGEFVMAATSGSVSTFDCGAPLDLNLLMAKLANPERLAPNRIRATTTLAEVTPEPVRREYERMRTEMEEAKAEAVAEGEDVDWFDEAVPSLDGTLTVTVEYGPGGRLDALVFDVTHELSEDRSTEHEEVRFANWGKPVNIAAPATDQIDNTPHIDEEGLAEVQTRFAVLAPTTVPAGWALRGVLVEERDPEGEICESVELDYGSTEFDASDFDPEGEEEGPALYVATVAPGCKWLDDALPDMSKARRVRVGAATARIVPETEDNYYSYIYEGLTAVLELNGTTVIASSNLPEAEFLQILKTLAPIDLSKQPLAP